MSFLVVELPERRRLSAASEGAGDAALVRPGQEYAWATSPDGLELKAHGSAPAALLPKAGAVVAVLSDADVAWHRITLPKAPAGRLREALVGVLEDRLLDEPETVHLALAPNASPGQPAWVAAVDRRWLVAQIAALERAGHLVDRVVAASWPDHPPTGHFDRAAGGQDDDDSAAGLVLNWSHAEGVVRLPVKSRLTRSLLPADALPLTRWTASPAAIAAAQHWTGAPVALMAPGQRALQAARSTLNLRQFDLAPKQRGTRWLRDARQRLMSPGWRPARIGLAALVAVQVLGLNLWAWQQRQAIADKRQALVATLQSSFPQVRAVLDAPVQMQREVERLRAVAGRAGDGDLEPLLQAASAAWPADRPAVDSLRYEPGRLSLSAAGWTEAQINQFRGQLQPAGWRVEAADGRLTLSRSASTGPSL